MPRLLSTYLVKIQQPWLWFGLVIVLAVVEPDQLLADTIVLKDGRHIEGQIVEEDATSVTVVSSYMGVRLTSRYPRTSIASIERVSRDGKSYCRIPVIGSIGADPDATAYLSARAFRAALEEAKKVEPDYVVLVIDSEGGSIVEMMGIIAAIREAKELEFVALVKRGISAAAMIALACPEIYMTPDSTIGAAVPFKFGQDGTPENVQEKFLSAMQAELRAMIEVSGHSPLLLRGMMELDLELVLVTKGGEPIVLESPGDPAARVLKPKGRILTLTATESVGCGLASGITDSIDSLGRQLGSDGWYEKDDRSWYHVINTVRVEQQRNRRELKRKRLLAERVAYIERINPILNRISARLVEVRARKMAAADAERDLINLWNNAIAAVNNRYTSLYREARSPGNPAYWTAQVSTAKNQKLADIEQQYQPQVSSAQRNWREALYEEEQLVAEWNELINSIPSVE